LAPSNIRVNALAPGFVPTDMHQATLKAGEARAGRMQFQRTQAIMNQAAPAMENVVDCVRMLISPALDELTGRTSHPNLEPWPSADVQELRAGHRGFRALQAAPGEGRQPARRPSAHHLIAAVG